MRLWVLAFLVAAGTLLASTPAQAHERRSSSLTFGFGLSYNSSRYRDNYSRPRRNRDRDWDDDRRYQRRYVDQGPPVTYYGRQYDPYDDVAQPRYLPDQGFRSGFGSGFGVQPYGNFYGGGYSGYGGCVCCGPFAQFNSVPFY